MPNLINACSSKEKQTTNNNGWMSYSTWTHLALENWHASFIQMDDIIHLFPLRVNACARPLAYMDKTSSGALNIAVPMHVDSGNTKGLFVLEKRGITALEGVSHLTTYIES